MDWQNTLSKLLDLSTSVSQRMAEQPEHLSLQAAWNHPAIQQLRDQLVSFASQPSTIAELNAAANALLEKHAELSAQIARQGKPTAQQIMLLSTLSGTAFRLTANELRQASSTQALFRYTLAELLPWLQKAAELGLVIATLAKARSIDSPLAVENAIQVGEAREPHPAAGPDLQPEELALFRDLVRAHNTLSQALLYRLQHTASCLPTPAAAAPIMPSFPSEEDEHEIGRGLFRLDEASSRSLPTRSDAPSEYPEAAYFAPAACYRKWTGDTPRSITTLVIHITDGHEKITGTIGHFQRSDSQASAHYVIGRDGEVVQMVRHKDIAWHATSANRYSIGIEHCARSPHEWDHLLPADKRPDLGLPVTELQYQASAKLVRWLCGKFGIPRDRDHIKGHCEAANTTHKDCPNRIWDWDHYMSLVKAEEAPASG